MKTKISLILMCLTLSSTSFAIPICPDPSTLKTITQFNQVFESGDNRYGMTNWNVPYKGKYWFLQMWNVEGKSQEAAAKRGLELLQHLYLDYQQPRYSGYQWECRYIAEDGRDYYIYTYLSE